MVSVGEVICLKFQFTATYIMNAIIIYVIPPHIHTIHILPFIFKRKTSPGAINCPK